MSETAHLSWSTDTVKEVQILAVEGDLLLRGREGDRVEAHIDPDELTIEQRESILALTARSDLALSLPPDLTVQIERVHGDALIERMQALLHLRSVGGDLVVRNSQGELSIDRVHGDTLIEQGDARIAVQEVYGDLSMRHIRGSVSLVRIHGDLRVQDTDADLILEQLDGDLRLHNCRGSVRLDHGHGELRAVHCHANLEAAVEGRVTLKGDFAPAQQIHCTTQGDIRVRLPEDASVTFHLQGADVRVDLPTAETHTEDSRQIVIVGSGDAQVELSAPNGSIRLRPLRPEPHTGPQIDVDVTVEMEGIAENIRNAVMMGLEEMRRGLREARKQAEQARREARSKAEQARRQARQARQEAQHRKRQAYGWAFSWAESHPKKSPHISNQGTEDERLLILRMLAEGKISTEEADRLLDALG